MANIAGTNTKSIIKNIIFQLLFALGSIIFCAVTALIITRFFSDNGIEAFIGSLFFVPVSAFISVAVSAAVLKERDIYFPVMLTAALLCSAYLLTAFGMLYFPFAILEPSGVIFGYFIGVSIRNKAIKKSL